MRFATSSVDARTGSPTVGAGVATLALLRRWIAASVMTRKEKPGVFIFQLGPFPLSNSQQKLIWDLRKSQKSYPYCQGMCPQSGTVRISIQLYLPPPNVRTKTDGLIIIFPKPKGELMISPTKSNELKWKKLEAR
ncbi:hypothetical protein D5086_020049 [Populus alba]|uniref:Uncharacterized protein n=1 Tax=Populus alba TaxID=43335 RepID=A0ACC4BJL0_POPAL